MSVLEEIEKYLKASGRKTTADEAELVRILSHRGQTGSRNKRFAAKRLLEQSVSTPSGETVSVHLLELPNGTFGLAEVRKGQRVVGVSQGDVYVKRDHAESKFHELINSLARHGAGSIEWK